jgi:hypothetical protein
MAPKSAKKHTVRRRRGGDDGPVRPPHDYSNKTGNPTIAFPPTKVRRGGVLTPSQVVAFSDSQIRDLTKGHKESFGPTQVRKTKGGRTRKLRGGYYGFDGALATGAANWGRSSEMGGFVANSSRGGNNAILGAGRKRRRSKKASRRTRRKMRGGGKYGGVSASFGGEGVAGLANYHGVTSRDNPGVPTGGKFNDYGAGPSSGFGSFVKAV